MTDTKVDDIPWPEAPAWPHAGEAATSSNNESPWVHAGPDLHFPEPEASRRPSGAPVTLGNSDVVKALGRRGRTVRGWWHSVSAGPTGWPLFARRCPSVAEVFRHGQDLTTKTGHKPWNSEAAFIRWPFRAFWIADALWETACMTARVWFRTRITWSVTLLALVAWFAWRH